MNHCKRLPAKGESLGECLPKPVCCCLLLMIVNGRGVVLIILVDTAACWVVVVVVCDASRVVVSRCSFASSETVPNLRWYCGS